jgi:hypothetical protein
MRQLLFVTLMTIALATPAAAQSGSCAGEAARLQRAEAELPKLEVAPPEDKQIVCITLETNILFARRLLAHLKQCPRSPYARSGAEWRRMESSYTARFSRRGCRQSIRGYRG